MATNAEKLITNGLAVDATPADNATATATLPATTTGLRYIVTGVDVSYSAAVALVRTITVTYTDPRGTAQTFTISRDFTYGGQYIPLGPLSTRQGTGVTVDLQASGTGGITGSVVLYAAGI